MFHASPSANTETWKYNAKGEVVTANHSTNNTFDRAYEFDGIGNRKKSADSLTLPSTDNYQANALNQYGSIDGNTRSFDDDGNWLDDGSKVYTWDAENRLIEIKKKSDNSTVATYAYDFRSRRITKTIGATETNFVYEGWNPIAVFAGTTLDKTYTWGMDLSGSMQGAGGVGGLLSVNDGSQTYYPVYDGNGNICQYVDSTGAVVAHYGYDVFGQVVASGTKANDFTHQFSTKQLDSESGLHYYGYRYYDSSTGSWINRDPIGEGGGLNIYGFVGNNGISEWDYLGLKRSGIYYTHWLIGGGVDMTVQFSDFDKGWGLSDAPFQAEVSTATDEFCKACEDQEVDVTNTVNYGATSVGQANVRLTGTVTKASWEKGYVFKGSFTIDDNDYDFEERTDRTPVNEFLTTLGGLPPGTDYTIKFAGERAVETSGTCL